MTNTSSCPICHATFTPTQPRHRYCSEPCRKIAWRRRHARPDLNQDTICRSHLILPRPPTVPRPRDVPRDVPATATLPEPDPPTRCPHCHRPVAVISLLVTPAAAQVTIPGTTDGH